MPSETYGRRDTECTGIRHWGVIRESLEPAPAPEDRESPRAPDGASSALRSQTRRLEPPQLLCPRSRLPRIRSSARPLTFIDLGVFVKTS